MNFSKKQRLLSSWLVAFLALAGFGMHATQASAYSAEQYTVERQFQPGTLLAVGHDGSFEAASLQVSAYAGVAMAQMDEKLELARSGQVAVLVTDADGEIRAGDRLGISALEGIAGAWQPGRVEVGFAREDLTAASNGWQDVNVEGVQDAHIARIQVQLSQTSTVTPGDKPFFAPLVASLEALVNKPLPPWRIAAAMIVAIGGTLLAFILMFGSSRQSFVSLGRNPMASAMILKGLWRVLRVAVVVIGVSVALGYLILRTG